MCTQHVKSHTSSPISLHLGDMGILYLEKLIRDPRERAGDEELSMRGAD